MSIIKLNDKEFDSSPVNLFFDAEELRTPNWGQGSNKPVENDRDTGQPIPNTGGYHNVIWNNDLLQDEYFYGDITIFRNVFLVDSINVLLKPFSINGDFPMDKIRGFRLENEKKVVLKGVFFKSLYHATLDIAMTIHFNGLKLRELKE